MRVGVIGAGPAGLTAAYRLQQLGAQVELFEASSTVGGLARTIELWGQRVDMGPHRFFSKDARVNRLWLEVIGRDYRMVERCTRIFYGGRFYDYPLRATNALRTMGPGRAAACLASYARELLSPSCPPESIRTFEDWVVSRFGRQLYEMFFKSYSEKLWGIPCHELDADFAAQRIKGFSLGEAVRDMLGLNKGSHRTLVDLFAYPTAGTGEVYERMSRAVVEAGGKVHLSRPIRKVATDGSTVIGIEPTDGPPLAFDHVVSTMPLTHLVRGLGTLPAEVERATANLRYRNTILVFLHVEAVDLFKDQWVYVHAPSVGTGRVTNFRNWVPELYGEQRSSVLACEYWCYDEDAIWTEADATLVDRATRELREISLLAGQPVIGGHVVRLPRCYPVYASGYKAALDPIVEHLRKFANLWPIGRYGSFKYNNQDHSILMGLLAAENIMQGAGHDLWAINTDYDTYQEEAVIDATGLVESAAPA
ncbi:MAG: FAD-dependent oxidoreductase [Geminicoccaceae bacterium]